MGKYMDNEDVIGFSANINGNDFPSSDGHFSSFGGYWTDRKLEIVRKEIIKKKIDKDIANLLLDFCQDGYVIIPEAVSKDLCDQVIEDTQKIINKQMPSRIITGFINGQRIEKLLDKNEDLEIRECKILDLHRTSIATEKIIFSDIIKRFFCALFEEEPLSFASLTFKYGSQQPLHRDTAFVKVDSPMNFAAVWVALEDVAEGSGELMYVPKSHRFKEDLFNGSSKWFIKDSPQGKDYGEYLKLEAKKYKQEIKYFNPKKGDALIWSNDLVHGGAPRLSPDKTRWSVVSHLCPLSRNPMYFYSTKKEAKRKTLLGNWVCSKEIKYEEMSASEDGLK